MRTLMDEIVTEIKVDASSENVLVALTDFKRILTEAQRWKLLEKQ